MPDPKIARSDLVSKVIAAGIQQKIDADEVIEVIQADVPAKALPRGRSQIVTYYDLAGNYLATYHRLVRISGSVHSHDHPKDARIGGIKYFDP